MKKLVFSMILGLTASIGYGQKLSCSSSEISFVADLSTKTLNAGKNAQLVIKDYAVNADGAGAVILESGNLVTLINEDGSLLGELFVEGRTYPALECTFN